MIVAPQRPAATNLFADISARYVVSPPNPDADPSPWTGQAHPIVPKAQGTQCELPLTRYEAQPLVRVRERDAPGWSGVPIASSRSAIIGVIRDAVFSALTRKRGCSPTPDDDQPWQDFPEGARRGGRARSSAAPWQRTDSLQRRRIMMGRERLP